jgi:hypothetical protein
MDLTFHFNYTVYHPGLKDTPEPRRINLATYRKLRSSREETRLDDSIRRHSYINARLVNKD